MLVHDRKSSNLNLIVVLALLVGTFSMFPIQLAHATGIRYATPNGTGNCSSWATACTLQTALTGAVNGSEIWAKAGIYKPITGTNRTATIQLKEGVAIYGGFAGTETARDQRNPAANVTILSGDIDNNDSQTPILTDLKTATGNNTNSYHVVTGATGAILDGFTITAGYANSDFPFNCGAGVYNSGSSPTFTNLIFSGNWATNSGGGIRNDSSSPTLTNVTFSGNSAGSGGGMINVSSAPTLTDVIFSNNTTPADGSGGGLVNYSSNPTLTRVIFNNNSADYGGGIFNRMNSSPGLTDVVFVSNTAVLQGGGMENVDSSSPTLTNVTFMGNMTTGNFGSGGGMRNFNGSNPILTNITFSNNSATYGGGIENNSNANPTLTNVTFSGNSASLQGGGVYNLSSNPQIRNTIFWNNSATSAGSQIYDNSSAPGVNDSVVQDGYVNGVNIITTDPLLGTLGDYGSFARVIPLLPGSSAIDTGNDSICPTSDERGITRPQGPHCDIGAFEYEVTAIATNTPTPTATATATTTQTPQNFTYDDGDAAWTYTGTWGAITTPDGPYLDTWHNSSAIGDSAQIAFSGAQFKLTYLAGPDLGMADVYVDGVKVDSLNEYNPYWAWQKIWVSNLLPAGSHTLRLVYASGGSLLDIDALEVMTPNILATGVYDDANAALNYSGSWANVSASSGPYLNTWRYTNTFGDSAQFDFAGRQVKLAYLAGPDMGVVDVYVDGVKAGSINENNSYWAWQKSWTSDLLPAGNHSVRLVYASGVGMMDLDSIEVITPTVLSAGVYDDANTAISYSGSANWAAMTTPNGPYLDTWHFSNASGVSIQAAFTGTQFKLTYLAGPDLGMADVYVDGVKVDSINEYTPYWAWQKIWVSNLLPAGEHNLRIVYVSGGSMVDIDALEVMTPNILATGVYDDAHAAINYSGSWANVAASEGPYLNTWRYTNTFGDSAQVDFTGRQVKVTYLAGPDMGVVDVYVDGVKAGSINENNPYWAWQKTWTSDLFAAGNHSLRLVYASGVGMMDLDSIEVVSPSILSAGVYDDTNAAISYDGSGNWAATTTANGPYLDTWHLTNTLGNAAQVAFSGTQIKLTYLAGPDLGSADVYVDGVKVTTINQNSSTWDWQTNWTSAVLSAGDHSVRIVYVSGGSMLSLDAITVMP